MPAVAGSEGAAKGPGRAERKEGESGRAGHCASPRGCQQPPPHGRAVPVRKRRKEGKRDKMKKTHFKKITNAHTHTEKLSQ